MDFNSFINVIAASLGQVYKGRLKETGDLVAVKVQRPYVLETVTIDLFIIRKLGMALRRFPQASSSFPFSLLCLKERWIENEVMNSGFRMKMCAAY